VGATIRSLHKEKEIVTRAREFLSIFEEWSETARELSAEARQSTGQPQEVSAAQSKEMYYHRGRENTDGILQSGFIRSGMDNFTDHVYRDWKGLPELCVVFGASKDSLTEFRSTMTNNVASNSRDLKLGEVKALVYDSKADKLYDVTPSYLGGLKTEKELLDHSASSHLF